MTVRILRGDCREVLKTLEDESVHCVVTSPPYFGLRDYGVAGQIGLEASPDAFVSELVDVFSEVRRVLRKDGTVWLNLGDGYSQQGGPGWQGKNGQRADRRFTLVRDTVRMREASRSVFTGLKPKDILGIPWRVAFALQADGWYLRQDIIWSKPNPMPESVRDRCTKAHEYIFLLSKSERYYYDGEAIAEPFADERMGNPGAYSRTTQAAKGANNDRADTGFLNGGGGWNNNGSKTTRNKRSVWDIATAHFPEAHFATFPPALIEPCIKAGCPEGGIVLDPFGGAGTTGLVADRLGRNAILIELNEAYAEMARRRIESDAPLFAEVK